MKPAKEIDSCILFDINWFHIARGALDVLSFKSL